MHSETKHKITPFKYDIFLSYNSFEEASSQTLKNLLKELDFFVWPEDLGQERLEEKWAEALWDSSVCILLFGPGGKAPWRNEQTKLAIKDRLRLSHGVFNVIPVLLPGTSSEISHSLLLVLNEESLLDRQCPFVHFKEDLNSHDALNDLVLMIRGGHEYRNSLSRVEKNREFIRHRARNYLNVNWGRITKNALDQAMHPTVRYFENQQEQEFEKIGKIFCSNELELNALRFNDKLGDKFFSWNLSGTPISVHRFSSSKHKMEEDNQIYINNLQSSNGYFLKQFLSSWLSVNFQEDSFPAISSSIFELDTALGFHYDSMSGTKRITIADELQKANKLESAGTLAGGIAHDFNKLLMSILGNISLAKLSLSPETQAFSQLLEVEKASLRAKDSFQQLLTFAKGGQPVKKPVRLVPILENAIHLIIRGDRIHGAYQLPNDLWDLYGEESQLNQAFYNIILNAQQAMPQGGTLEIDAKNFTAIELQEIAGLPLEENAHVRIRIKDSGCGISKEHLAHIFDPYFTTKPHGHGLGLATTYSIITSHNGGIEVSSTIGKGTVFTIYLPASSVHGLEYTPTKTDFRLGHGKILVMDDEESIRNLLEQMLIHLGYTVEVTNKGEDTIEQFAKAQELHQPFSAVILDLTISGGMGGKETIQRLQLLDPKVRAIVAGNNFNDRVLSNYESYGFQEKLEKPFRLQNLSEAINQVLGKCS